MPTPPTPSVPSAPPASSTPRSRTTLYLVVAAMVMVVVLLVAFVALPALTPTSGPGGGPAILTYRGAAPIANGTAAGYSGGGWTLLFGAGLVSATNETFPVNATSLGNLSSYCTFTAVTNLSRLVLPGYTGNRSSGASPAWVFGYRNESDTIAVVAVIDGHGTVVATLSGTFCAFGAALAKPVPGNVIDSSAAVAAVQPEAHAFLVAHPNASAEFALVGGGSFGSVHLGTDWSIAYSTCTFSPTGPGTGDEFNATVNALTGHVISTNTTSGISCDGGLTTSASPGPGASAPAPISASVTRARPSEPA